MQLILLLDISIYNNIIISITCENKLNELKYIIMIKELIYYC